MTLGQRIKQLRDDDHMTQQELADRTHIARSTLGMYEQDRRRPGFEELDTLADYFDVSFDYLLGRSDVNTGYPMHGGAFDEEGHYDPQMNRLLAYHERIIKAYEEASPDTQAAVRAILHVEEPKDGDR